MNDDKKQKQEDGVQETNETEEIKVTVSNAAGADERDEEVERLQSEVEENKSKYLRVLADYQNLEKRGQEQRRELLLHASQDILLKILPILDTLQLAKKHSEDKALGASIQQFLAILSAEGVTPIKTVGREFDPLTMECLTTEAGKDNVVTQELRTGYMLNSKVLRPAQVAVGNGDSEEKN